MFTKGKTPEAPPPPVAPKPIIPEVAAPKRKWRDPGALHLAYLDYVLPRPDGHYLVVYVKADNERITSFLDRFFELSGTPEAVSRPAWLYAWLRNGRIPELSVPNLPVGGAPAPTFFGAYAQWMASAPPSWDDVAWLREQWGGPFMLKGVTRVDDAKRAVDAGVTAIPKHQDTLRYGSPSPLVGEGARG